MVTEPRGARRRRARCSGARQEPGRVRRPRRVHRQHPAVRVPQPRGLDVRGALRLPRGHRRRHALRLRLPDGPARAARPDRSRHGVRDPRHDVQAGPRPPARAGADPQADGHRRAARPEVRPRLLHLRGARQLQGRARPPDPVARRRSRSCAATSAGSASSAPAPWRRESSRCSPRPGTTCCTSAGPTPRSRACTTTIERSLDKAVQRGKLEESARDEVARPADRIDLARGASPTATSWSRRSPRTCA